MSSNHAGGMFNGKLRVSNGTYRWDGACGTHTWIDSKEKVVSVQRDFENAVMQAIVE